MSNINNIKKRFNLDLHWNTYVQHFLKNWYGPFFMAILCTAVCVKKINQYKNNLKLNAQTIEVLISTKTLQDGDTLKFEDLQSIALPQKYLPTGVMYPSDLNKVIGMALNKSIAKEEFLLWSSLNIDMIHEKPSDHIEPGHRSLSLSADQNNTLGYRIHKGDYIDLIHTTILEGDKHPSTYTLLQNILVLDIGVDLKTDEIEPSYNNLILMVLPKEANLIINAQQYGELSFLLRNQTDQETEQKLPMISQKEITQAAFRNTIQNEHNIAIDIIKGNKRVLNAKQMLND